MALAVSLPTYSIFDTFISNGNEALIVQLQVISKQANIGETLFISGSSGTGKTHLLQAACHAAPEKYQATYLDLSTPDFPPDILQGWDNSQLICLDNIDVVQGSSVWEEALFDLFNRRLDRDTKQRATLLMTAKRPLKELDFRLPDLRSRLSSGLIYQVQGLQDAHLPLALHAHAQQRGLDIPNETMEYLLKRLPRELSSLMQWLDNVDKAALEAKRKLTIPFVKSLMQD